jgi:hypothetical protein
VAASAENELESPRYFSEWKRLASLKSHAGDFSYRELAKRRCRAPAGAKLRVALKTLGAGAHRLV